MHTYRSQYSAILHVPRDIDLVQEGADNQMATLVHYLPPLYLLHCMLHDLAIVLLISRHAGSLRSRVRQQTYLFGQCRCPQAGDLNDLNKDWFPINTNRSESLV